MTGSFQSCLATMVLVPESVDGEVLLLRRPVLVPASPTVAANGGFSCGRFAVSITAAVAWHTTNGRIAGGVRVWAGSVLHSD